MLIPDASDESLELHARSMLGQMLHYHMVRPFIEMGPMGSLDDPETRTRVREHVTRFSLRALGVRDRSIDAALSRIDGLRRK